MHPLRTRQQGIFSLSQPSNDLCVNPCNSLTITLMYYVDFYSLFKDPEKDRQILLCKASDASPD